MEALFADPDSRGVNVGWFHPLSTIEARAVEFPDDWYMVITAISVGEVTLTIEGWFSDDPEELRSEVSFKVTVVS